MYGEASAKGKGNFFQFEQMLRMERNTWSDMKLLTPDPGLLLWTLLAFLIVFFILKKMAWPAIIKGLNDREKSIEDAISTAERVKAEMAR
jgi:hypothetical protein